MAEDIVNSSPDGTDFTEEQLPFPIRMALAEREKASAAELLWLLQMRYKVNKRIGNEQAAAACTADMLQFQGLFDFWDETVKSLKKSQNKSVQAPTSEPG